MNNAGDACKKEKAAIKKACGEDLKHAKCPSSKGIKDAKAALRRRSNAASRAAAQAELDTAYRDYSAAMQQNDCQRALRCAMMPYKGGKSACCPHQTPEHIIQGAQFFYGKAAGGRRRNGCSSYKYRDAPCVCAEGGATVATHGLLGGARKAHIDAKHAGKETWAFKDAVACGAKSTAKVFPNCTEDCLEAQLRQGGHADMDDDTQIGLDQSDTMGSEEAKAFRKRWTQHYATA